MTVDDFVKVFGVISPVLLGLVVYLTGRQASASARRADLNASEAATAAKRVEGTLKTTTSEVTNRLAEIRLFVDGNLSEARREIKELREALRVEEREGKAVLTSPAAALGAALVQAIREAMPAPDYRNAPRAPDAQPTASASAPPGMVASVLPAEGDIQGTITLRTPAS